MYQDDNIIWCRESHRNSCCLSWLTHFLMQVSFCVREIDPAEYDLMAQRYPASCPLVSTGDLRSGQQVMPRCLLP